LAQVLLSLFLVVVCGVGSSYADFVMFPTFDLGHPLSWVVILLAFGATTIIEYPAIYWILGRPKKAKKSLFLCVLLVNAITNPLAQLGVWFLDGWFTIELAVVAVEFGLMVWIFKRMYNSGKFDRPITLVRTAVTVLVANLISFVLGVAVLLALIAISPPRPF
jgi:hypothetical protein